MRFDGRDAVVMPDDAAPALGPTFTVPLWVYPEQRGYAILAQRTMADPDSDPYFSFRLNLDAEGHVAWGSTRGTPGSQISGRTPDVLPLKQWSHIAVTNDGSFQRIYINGVQAAQQRSPGAPAESGQPIHLGAQVRPAAASNPGFAYAGFVGMLRQFGIWNYAMSPAEVNDAMRTHFDGNESGLLGFWPLDDGPGYSFRDITQARRGATLLYPRIVKYVNGDKTRATVDQYWPVWFRPSLWEANPFEWSEHLQGPVDGAVTQLYPIDFDNDGDLDLLGASFWNPSLSPTTLKAFRNDGNGSFSEVTNEVFGETRPPVLGPKRGVVADLNGDGRSDFILGNSGSDYIGNNIGQGQNRVFVQTPDGRLVDETETRIPVRSDFAHDNDGADVDLDGHVDLVFADINFHADPDYIYPKLMMNDGSGHFAIDVSRLPASLAARQFFSARFLDANRDGYPDLFLGSGGANTPDGRDVLLLNDKTGHFLESAPGTLPPRQGGAFCGSRRAEPGDLNNDGWPDLVLSIECSAHAGFQVLINRGDGTFADGTLEWLPDGLVQLSPIAANHIIDSGDMYLQDFNGDGFPELLLNREGAFWRYFLNDGMRLVNASDFLPFLRTGAFAVADFDGDGHRDIVASTSDGAGNALLKVGLNHRDYSAPAPASEAAAQDPVIGPLSILNDASLTADTLAPGERIRIRGRNLGPAEPVTADETARTPLPTRLGDVTVTFDSTPARLISVSATEIVAMAPFTLAGKWVTRVQVLYQERSSAAVNYLVASSEPMVYARFNSSGQLVADVWKLEGQTRTKIAGPGQLKWGDRIAFRLTGAGQGAETLSDESSTGTANFNPATALPVYLGMPLDSNKVRLQPVSMTYAPDGLSGVVEVVVDLPASAPAGTWVIFSVPDAVFLNWTRKLLLPIGVAPADGSGGGGGNGGSGGSDSGGSGGGSGTGGGGPAPAGAPPDQPWQLRFDGLSAMALPLRPELDLGANYTFLMWVFAERANTPSLLRKQIPNAQNSPNFALVLGLDQDRRIWFSQTNGEPGSGRGVYTSTVLPVGAWTHLAAASDGTNLVLYINGVEAGRAPSPGSIPVNNFPIAAGGLVNENGYGCCAHAGLLRQLSAWNRALSQDEIRATMAKALQGNESGLVGYWPMDDGPGYTFRDLGPNRLDAKLIYPDNAMLMNGVTSQTLQYQPSWLRTALWSTNPFDWAAQPQAQTARQIPMVQRLYAMDFDSDGDIDLISAGMYNPGKPAPSLKAYRNDGKGGFQEATAEVLGAPPILVRTATGAVVADLNRDGRADMILGDYGSDFAGADNGKGQNRVLIQTADGQLRDETSTRLPMSGQYVHDMDGADLDGDGHLDLVYPDVNGGPFFLTVAMNDGSGRFVRDNSRLPQQAAGRYPTVTRLFDANGDGSPDLFLGSGDVTSVPGDLLLLNDGRGRFQSMLSGALPPRAGGANCGTVGAGVGDLNGDRRPDLLLSIVCGKYTDTGFQVLINRGNATYSDETAQWLPDGLLMASPQFANSFPWMRTVNFADFDGDGRLDVVFQSMAGQHRLFMNTGTRLVESTEFLPNFERVFGGGGDLVVADFDRDGKPDIALADQASQASYDTLWIGMIRRAFPAIPVPAPADPAAPGFLRLGVLNEASLSADPLAPGTRIRIRGNRLGPNAPVNFNEAPGAVAPTTLGGVTVTFNGIPARLISVSASEITAVVPFSLAGSFVASIQVNYDGKSSPPVLVPVTASDPQLFITRDAGATPYAQAWKFVNGMRTKIVAAGQLNWGDRVALRISGIGQSSAPVPDGVAPSEQSFPPVEPVQVLLGSPGQSITLTPASVKYGPEGQSGVSEVVVDLPASPPPGFSSTVYVQSRTFPNTFPAYLPVGGTAGAAGACSYTVSPSLLNVSAGASTQVVTVTTSALCEWEAAPMQNWMGIESGVRGMGSGTVRVALTANTGAAPRTGSLRIAGQPVTVSQMPSGQ